MRLLSTDPRAVLHGAHSYLMAGMESLSWLLDAENVPQDLKDALEAAQANIRAGMMVINDTLAQGVNDDES